MDKQIAPRLVKPISTSRRKNFLAKGASTPVSIAIRHSDELGLCLAEYEGVVTIAQLRGVADFMATALQLLKRDCLAVVEADADFSSIKLADLDDLFAHYRRLFAPMSVQVFRRSAWICRSSEALAHIKYWVGDRDTRTSVASDIRLFETEAEAGRWLTLSPSEIVKLARREGFRTLATFAGLAQSASA
jgi:hypothetical protein